MLFENVSKLTATKNMVEEDTEQLVFDAATDDWPIESVTVYESSGDSSVHTAHNLAEITRNLKFAPPDGQKELILEGLPETIKPESIKTELKSLHATILEVSYDQKWVKEETTERSKKIKEYEERIDDLRKQYSRVVEKKDWVTQYANAVIPVDVRSVSGDGLSGDTVPISALLMDKSSIDKVDGFISFLDEQGEKLDKDCVVLTKEINKQVKELEAGSA